MHAPSNDGRNSAPIEEKNQPIGTAGTYRVPCAFLRRVSRPSHLCPSFSGPTFEHDLSLFQNDDTVGARDQIPVMSDNKRRASFPLFANRATDVPDAAGIEGRT